MTVKTQPAENASVSGECVSIRIVKQLADAEDLDPDELPSLFPEIDLEVLDTFIDSAPTDTTVSFSVTGYDITVTGDGTVSLDSSPDT